MIRINLLPVRQLKKRNRIKAEFFGFLSILAMILVILAGIAISLAASVSSLKKEIADLDQKKNSYTPILKEIEKLQNDKRMLENKLTAIKDLQKESQTTVHILDEVATLTPTSRMWLTSLQQATTNTLQLQGVALDNETIAQYMLQLDSSQYFSNIELAGTSQTDIAGKKLKSFSLTLNVTNPTSNSN